MKKILAWILQSSIDPTKMSLTVKSVLIGLIPLVVQAVTVTCGLGLVCLGVTNESLEAVIKVISDVVFWTLSIVSGVGFVVGFFRKVFLTVTGKNRSI